ncbi:MAG: nitroreductase family deazaflavin-dependent oxidoreductase [Acidimicrobiales bacterium]
MVLPRGLARFNRVATNHVSRTVAGHLPWLGIVTHEGRRSGRRHRTPVNVFRRDGGFVVALTYGPDTDWAKNVLAAGRAEITTRGRTYGVTNPRIVEDADPDVVPRPVRTILRRLDVDQFLLLDTDVR